MPKAVFVALDGHTDADDFVMTRARRNADACGLAQVPPYQGIYVDPHTRERVHLFTDPASLPDFHRRSYRPAKLSTSEREAKRKREQAVLRAAENQTALAIEGVFTSEKKRKGEGE